MPRLEDLQKDLKNMSPDELLDRIRQIRADRVIRKSGKVQRAAKVKTRTKAEQLIASLTPQQIAELLKGLE